MPTSLIDQGLNLMLYGMGTVFVFLTLLVLATNLMSTLVQRFAPADETPTALHMATPGAVSPQVRSAIEKAIRLHRQG